MSTSTKIKGDALVIRIKKESGTYAEIAAATNHTLNYSIETSSVTTKSDYDPTKDGAIVWANEEATKGSWEVTCESLVSLLDGNDADNLGYNDITEFIGKQVDLQLYNKKTGTGAILTKEGKAILKSLQLSMQTGETASFSATFSGCGELKNAVQSVQ